MRASQAEDSYTSLIIDRQESEEELPVLRYLNPMNNEISLQSLYNRSEYLGSGAASRKMGTKRSRAELQVVIDAGQILLGYTGRRANGILLRFTGNNKLSGSQLVISDLKLPLESDGNASSRSGAGQLVRPPVYTHFFYWKQKAAASKALSLAVCAFLAPDLGA